VRSAAPERALPSRAAFLSICVAQRPPDVPNSASWGAMVPADGDSPRVPDSAFSSTCSISLSSVIAPIPQVTPGKTLTLRARIR
jgi:hypothetical protein